MKILDIPIETLSRKEILARVENFLDEPSFHRIATVNPEFLLEAEKNDNFKKSLLDADLRVVDGFGIVLAGWLKGKCVERFPGADLMEEILRIAEQKKLNVFLAINKNGLSSFEEIKQAILKKYPNLEIIGEEVAISYYSSLPPEAVKYHSSIIFCNYGAPKQEIFLESLRQNSGNIRLAMGVGGSFDYLTGQQKRAPKCLRNIGLEWLWRLILQPKRFKRIWNATAVFLFNLAKNPEKSHNQDTN